MKLSLVAVLAASIFSTVVPKASAQAPAAPAPAKPPSALPDLATIHKLREKLIGKWINIAGESLTLADGGTFSLSSPRLQERPDMPKELTGTFVVTEDLQLKVVPSAANAKPIISEFSVDSAQLRIKNKNGTFSVYQRYSNQAVADLTLRELEMLDAAIDQFAIEKNKPAGATATPDDLRKYLRKEMRIYFSLGEPGGPKDLLGNSYGALIVDKFPHVHPATVKALSDVAPRAFWKRFAE